MTDKKIAAPMPEPDDYQMLVGGVRWAHCAKHIYDACIKEGVGTVRALYTAPPAAPAPATSADYAMGYAEGFNDACKPTPVVREPLTQDAIVGLATNYEERYHRWVFICVDELEQFARAIEEAVWKKR